MFRNVFLVSLLFVAMATNALAAPSQSVMLDVVSDAYVEDFEPSGIFDGKPNRISNTNALIVGKLVTSDGKAIESHGVMVFDLTAYKGKDSAVNFAAVTGFGRRVDRNVVAPITVQLYAYTSNPLINLADYNAPAKFITEFTLPGVDPNNNLFNTLQYFEIDVTNAVKDVLKNSPSMNYIKFRFESLDASAFIAAGEIPKDFFQVGAEQYFPKLKIFSAESGMFVRGDANYDGKVDISDSIYLANYVYQRGTSPKCLDAADVDDNGRIDVNDSTYLLQYLYGGGQKTIPAPFAQPGVDPTADILACGEAVLKGQTVVVNSK